MLRRDEVQTAGLTVWDHCRIARPRGPGLTNGGPLPFWADRRRDGLYRNPKSLRRLGRASEPDSSARTEKLDGVRAYRTGSYPSWATRSTCPTGSPQAGPNNLVW